MLGFLIGRIFEAGNSKATLASKSRKTSSKTNDLLIDDLLIDDVKNDELKDSNES